MSEFLFYVRRGSIYFGAALVIFFLVAPVFIVVPMSFTGSQFLDFPPRTWSVRWYEKFFTDRNWFGSLIVSLKLAVATVLVATPLGVSAAYALHSGKHRSLRYIHTLLLLPMIVPHIIMAVGLFYIYVRIGWLGTFGGLLAAHIMLAMPFVVVTSLSGLRSYDMAQEQVARSLGCNRLEAFWWITFPQIKGSIFSGMIFAFVISLDELVVALLVASGSNITITKVMFGALRDEMNPTIAAVSALLIGGSLVIATLAAFSSQSESRRMPAKPRVVSK